MSKKIFIDANVILDLFESKRVFHYSSVKVVKYLLTDKNIELFVSSDMISNIFYILQNHYKYGFEKTLDVIEKIMTIMSVHSVSKDDIKMSIEICRNELFNDYEDALQYICALKEKCVLIISNNPKDFKNSSIDVFSSEAFLELIRKH